MFFSSFLWLFQKKKWHNFKTDEWMQLLCCCSCSERIMALKLKFGILSVSVILRPTLTAWKHEFMRSQNVAGRGAHNRAKFKLNTQRWSNESFQDVKALTNVAKMSHIQNLEVNKVASAKQISEAGNHDMPQRALFSRTHARPSTIFQKHESCDRWDALPDYSLHSTVEVTDLRVYTLMVRACC